MINLKKVFLLVTMAILYNTSICFSQDKKPKKPSPNYKKLIIGKWVWYKTITTGAASSGKALDTFYNKGMFKEYFANGKVIVTESDGTFYTEKYFLKGNKLGTIYANNDTGYCKIMYLNRNTFAVYDRVVYTNVKPNAIVEYWHYFAK